MLQNPSRFGTSAKAPVTVTPVKSSNPVTPAKAGVQYGGSRRPMRQCWIPAFAGMTAGAMDASAVFAGMTALEATRAKGASAAFAGATTFKACAAITAGTDFNRNIAP